LIGMTWEMQRRYEEAARSYELARRIAPNEARAHRILGTRLLRWGEPEGAIEPLGRAVELEPSNAETWNAFALARYHADDLDGARATFERGIALHPDHRGLYLGLAALLINAHEFARALAVYDRVIDRWDEFADAHVGRAILLHELGRTREAEAAFERAIEVARDPRPYEQRLRDYRALLAGDAVPADR
jgi:protein O-GlcNAc transferase